MGRATVNARAMLSGKHRRGSSPGPIPRVLFNLYAASTPRAAGVQQSVRTCYFLALAGATVELHICTQFFRAKSELLRFFGLEDLANFEVRFYTSPFSARRELSVFGPAGAGRPLWALNYLWGALFHLRRILRLAFRRGRGRRDLIFLRGHRFPAFYVALRRLLGLTAVYELHEISYLDNIVESQLLAKRVALDFERYAYRHADGVVFISHTLRKLAQGKWGPVRKGIVLSSGARRLDCEPLPPGVALDKLMFVGNYYYFSGLEYAVRALTELDDVELVIVGGGGEGDRDRDRLARLVRSLDLEARVDFRGFVEPRALAEVYAEAHILIMPHSADIRSRYFVSPVKLFEYLGARRPIVASDLPTVREVLEDGENAVLVEPENPTALAHGVRRLLDDGDFARRMAEAAYEDALAHSLPVRGERLAQFFSEVLADAADGSERSA